MQLNDTIERLESNIRGYVRSFPTVFQSAKGAWLTDNRGKRYLDFFAGAGTLNYGHNNPLVKKALLSFLENDGVMHGLDMATTAKIELLEAIDEILLKPRGLDYKVQFSGPTGTNAVEAAIKLARKSKQRSHIVAFTNAYHGHSLGSLALTGNQYGINVASFAWLRRIADICKAHDILLIVDDIQVGNGRTGTFFSFERAGIEPDIVCLSKAIGGGLPISLVFLRRECDTWKPGEHTGTFRGNNLAFVAARQLLEYWRDDEFGLEIGANGVRIELELKSIRDQFGSVCEDVRGRGMIWGLEFAEPEMAGRVCRQAFQNGLMIETSGARDQVVKLLPPLTISREDLRCGLAILADSIQQAIGQEPVTSKFYAPDISSLEPGIHIGSFASL